MFQYLIFDSSSILIGLMVAIVVSITLVLSVQLWNKQHTPISLGLVALFALFYFMLAVAIVGMAESKEELRDYQQTTTYKLVQEGRDILDNIHPSLNEYLSPFVSEQLTPEYIENQCKEITCYEWFAVIVGIFVFVLGVYTMKWTGSKPKSRRGYSRSHRDDDGRVSRSRHRSDY